VSTMVRNRCPASVGISVQHAPESVSSIRRNRCPACVGICTTIGIAYFRLPNNLASPLSPSQLFDYYDNSPAIATLHNSIKPNPKSTKHLFQWPTGVLFDASKALLNIPVDQLCLVPEIDI
jgi:hypothetical protein